MGLFGDKLLLRLNATPTSTGKLTLHIAKADDETGCLLPFSCVSVIGSQLTVLSSHHARSLSKSLLEFIETPKVQYEPLKLISSFRIEIYKRGKLELINQFFPETNWDSYSIENNELETDVEHGLLNYITTVYEGIDKINQSNLRVGLLAIVFTYQDEFVPMIRKSDMANIRQRTAIAKSMVNITSAVYGFWNPGKPMAIGKVTIGNPLFLERLEQARRMSELP